MARPSIKKELLSKHLGRHVLRTTTIRVSNFILFNVRFWEPKISYLDATLDIEQNILQLDVSEQNVVLMKVFQSLKDLREYRFGLLLWKRFNFLHVVVQVAIRAVLQPENYVVFSLKCIVKVNQVFVFDRK